MYCVQRLQFVHCQSDLKVYGIHVREDFRRKSPDTGTALEQIQAAIVDKNPYIEVLS